MKNRFWNRLALLTLLLAMTACGSGGGDSEPTPQATLVVWAKGFPNNLGMPLNVFVNGQSVGQLTASEVAAATQPPASGGSVLRINRAAGDVTVRASNGNGQSWFLGTSTLTNGQATTVVVDAGAAGALSFGHAANAAALYPITVVLDGADTLGVLLSPATSTACDAPNSLTRLRPAGSYRYSAHSADRRCLWTGSITATAGACTTVALPTCN